MKVMEERNENVKDPQIDDIIEKQQTIIEKLKEYKLSVINEAVTHGINPEVEMKDSGYKWIGDIPKHWNMVYAKQLFTQRKDATNTHILMEEGFDFGARASFRII